MSEPESETARLARESLQERVPCPDEMCVGIIGPSGRCGTCGRVAEPGTPLPSEPESSAADVDENEEPAAVEEREAATDGFDAEERVLCPDEMCTGILGPDGRCGTCGRKG